MATLNDHSPESLSSLSAMFDDEATGQDLEFLLNEKSFQLNEQLEAFHLIRQVLHKDSRVCIGLQGDFTANVRAKIDAEDAEDKSNLIIFPRADKKQRSKPTWQVMFSSVAVAASVTVVVILGGNSLLTPDYQDINVTADNALTIENKDVASLADLNAEPSSKDNIRLQHYLRQHAEQAAMTVGQGMIPMARVVSYPVEE